MKPVGAQPFPVGILSGDLFFDLFISHNSTLVRIDEKYTTRFETTFFNNGGWINFENTNF